MKTPDSFSWWKRWKERFSDFLLGTALSWVIAPYTIRKSKEFESMFALLTTTRLLGMPIIPPIYELKLLPYLTPSLLNWRRITAFHEAIQGADLKHLGH